MKRYVVGNGMVDLGSGIIKEFHLPFVSINERDCVSKIGADAMHEQKPIETMIVFKNLEGLAVFELMLKNCKKHLKRQEKLK